MRLPARLTGRAVTSQSPSLMPRTSAVTATGPLPGTTPSTVTSLVKLSPGLGFPLTPARRPENQITTRYGSPPSSGSNQKAGVRTGSSTFSAQPVLPSAAPASALASGEGTLAVAGSDRVTALPSAARTRARLAFFDPGTASSCPPGLPNSRPPHCRQPRWTHNTQSP